MKCPLIGALRTPTLSCYSLIPFVAASHTAHLAADIGFIRKSMRGA